MRPSAIPRNWEGRKRNPIQEQGDTHECESVRAWVIDNIFLQFLARNPSRNELKRSETNAQEWKDVRVREAFPYDSHTVDRLLVSSTVPVGKDDWA